MIQEIFMSYDVSECDIINVCENLEQHSLQIAQQRVGKGYKRMMIKKIIKIDEKSITPPIIKSTSINADATVNMRVLCEVETFLQDRIILDCNVNYIDGELLYCNSENQKMIIKSKMDYGFEKDNLIIGQIEDSEILPNRSDPIFICNIYIPSTKYKMFIIDNDIQQYQLDYLKSQQSLFDNSFDTLKQHKQFDMLKKTIFGDSKMKDTQYIGDILKQLQSKKINIDTIIYSDVNIPNIQFNNKDESVIIDINNTLQCNLYSGIQTILTRGLILIGMFESLLNLTEAQLLKYEPYFNVVQSINSM